MLVLVLVGIPTEIASRACLLACLWPVNIFLKWPRIIPAAAGTWGTRGYITTRLGSNLGTRKCPILVHVYYWCWYYVLILVLLNERAQSMRLPIFHPPPGIEPGAPIILVICRQATSKASVCPQPNEKTEASVGLRTRHS